MTDNMRIWDQVCKTDPANTKEVAYGKRKFTAIDAYSQIKRATELWGPVGHGWGWDIINTTFPGETIAIEIRLAWCDDGEDVTRYISAIGQAVLSHEDKTGKSKPDADCAKKALTDAITKGLSYLGFNADVFEGKFDDNKYVQQRTKEVAKGKVESPGIQKAKDAYRALVSDIAACEDISALDGLVLAPRTLKMIERFKEVIPEWYEGNDQYHGLETKIETHRVYLTAVERKLQDDFGEVT